MKEGKVKSKIPKAVKLIGAVLALAGGIFGTCSCASAYPLAGATVAGAATAMVFPPAVLLAIPAGYGIGVLAEGDDATGKLQENQIVLMETVAALTAGDVDAIVAMRLEQANSEGGMIDRATQAIYDFVKMMIAAVVCLIIGVFLYVLYRRHVGQKFYKMVSGASNADSAK